MEKIHYFMVGMPSGGKTSYIVRLCSQLINESNMMYKLVDGRLPDGLCHIQEQMDMMDSFQNIMRTFENVCYDITLPLVNETGENISLVIPDLSGEHYRRLVEERYISKMIYDRLQKADTILFFINTETMENEERLDCNEASTASLIEQSMKKMEEQDNEKLPMKKIPMPEKATQSQVVDLIQILLGLVKKKIRVKFVISAWDRVEKKISEEDLIPEDYLKGQLPLLYQYIISNSDKLEYEVFGVSAQGAEYADKREMERLQDADVDIETLVKVVMPDGTKYQDISRLLRKWEQI